MPKRIKKGDPELLLISFCDIVTITTAAMFMAMVVTIQQAIAIPVMRATPRMKSVADSLASKNYKWPVFFECRGNQVFPIQKEIMMDKVNQAMKKVGNTRDNEQILTVMRTEDIGDQYYKADPVYVLVGQLVLEPKEGVASEGPDEIVNSNSLYRTALYKINPVNQSIVYLVRDDSFAIFRRARDLAAMLKIESGWEYLGNSERLRFGLGGNSISTQ